MRCVVRRRAAGRWRLPRITMATARSLSPCATMVPGSQSQRRSAFSSISSPRKRKVSEWVLPSCARSSKHMGEALQPKTPIERHREEQIIFITGHGNIPMCAQAMKAGAVDFLPKPFKPKELLASVERALRRSAEQRRRAAEKNHARGLLERLTPREFQVMQLVITGLLNKQVGAELGMAEKTVKTHRGHVMQKLGITSVAELMGVLQRAEVPSVVRPGAKV